MDGDRTDNEPEKPKPTQEEETRKEIEERERRLDQLAVERMIGEGCPNDQ